MTREEKIIKIIEIIYESEDKLSDGYNYYSCQDTEEEIKNIAEKILKTIED